MVCTLENGTYEVEPIIPEIRTIFQTELDEVIGITGAKREGRLQVNRCRRATTPLISMTNITTGEK